MERQEYLRPHDICVLLQLAIRPGGTFRELSAAVGLSLGEVHNSAKRLEIARLAASGAPHVNKQAALEFLSFGVPYAYPAHLGSPTQGIPTAFSAEPLSRETFGVDDVVWPSPTGQVRGLALTPLCPSIVDVWERNPELYHLVALVDGIRVGRARERRSARRHLDVILSSVGTLDSAS